MRDGLAARRVGEGRVAEEKELERRARGAVRAVDGDVRQQSLLEELGQGGDVVLVVFQVPRPVARHAPQRLMHQRPLRRQVYPRQAIQPPRDIVACRVGGRGAFAPSFRGVYAILQPAERRRGPGGPALSSGWRGLGSRSWRRRVWDLEDGFQRGVDGGVRVRVAVVALCGGWRLAAAEVLDEGVDSRGGLGGLGVGTMVRGVG